MSQKAALVTTEKGYALVKLWLTMRLPLEFRYENHTSWYDFANQERFEDALVEVTQEHRDGLPYEYRIKPNGRN